MKVAFDISILGAEERTPQNRTGIYKAIEALLKQLLLLKKQGLAEDLELLAFSSDVRHLEGSKTVWARLQASVGCTEDSSSYIDYICLNRLHRIGLWLSERKGLRKQKEQPYLLESIAMWVFRPFFRQASRGWITIMANFLPKNTVIHIPFTRDLGKFPPVSRLTRVVTCYDLTPIVCEARAKANPKEKENH